MPNSPEPYLVKSIALDAPSKTLVSDLWSTANLLQDFRYPWDDALPPPTYFRALHSRDTFFFKFEVIDPDLNALVVDNEQMEVAESDRVELFFCKDENLAPYYCLEMDYLGRLLCNSAKYHRQMDYDWNWPSGLHFESKQTTNGFSVEGSISKNSLLQLGLLSNNELRVGIFRGEYSSQAGQNVRWISWIDPQTPDPDFHTPSAFGLLKLL